jgi:hypothetical protein
MFFFFGRYFKHNSRKHKQIYEYRVYQNSIESTKKFHQEQKKSGGIY